MKEKYIPLRVVQELFEAKKGQDMVWWYNKETRTLEDIEGNEAPTIEMEEGKEYPVSCCAS